MLSRGCWGQSLPLTLPWQVSDEHAYSLQFRLLNKVYKIDGVSGKCVCTVKDYPKSKTCEYNILNLEKVKLAYNLLKNNLQ